MVTEDKDLTFIVGEILGLQPRDEAAMLVVKKYSLLKNLHENGVKLQEERNAFVTSSPCKPSARCPEHLCK